jgi:methionyl-tRNA formyltransferase
LEAGDKKTGVCLQKVVFKLDAGDVLGSRMIDLDDEINSLELHDKLAELGAELLHIELMDYVRGNLVGIPQNESFVTYAKKIEKSEAELDFKLPAAVLHNKVRAFVWGPGTFTQIDGKRLKVHKTRVGSSGRHFDPGFIVDITKSSFSVQTGDGVLEILEVQPESKTKMKAGDFVSGFQVQKGARLG